MSAPPIHNDPNLETVRAMAREEAQKARAAHERRWAVGAWADHVLASARELLDQHGGDTNP